jgi:lysophospholipase L1-like esterase
MVPWPWTVLSPEQLPPPTGSHWERTDPERSERGERSRLVRFPAEWRDVIRRLTALRCLEVGVSTWQFVTDTPYLCWEGRWQNRRETMRRLEVVVDGQIVTSKDLADAEDDTALCLFDGLDGQPHQVVLHFPPTSTLELRQVMARPGALFIPHRPHVVWCSWGDSITQGTLCDSAQQSYVQIATRALGWTAVNRGFGGAGCPDPMTAVAIAADDTWHVLTIAIGVNDAALGMVTAREFALMYTSCLNILTERRPTRPIVCVSPIVCTLEQSEAGVPVAARTRQIRQMIRDVVLSMDQPSVLYLDGLDLLSEEDALVDDIHPGVAGHALMAERLASRLAAIVRGAGLC